MQVGWGEKDSGPGSVVGGGAALVLKSWPPWVWASALAMAVGMDRRWPCFSCSQPRRAPSGGLFWGSPE